MAPMGAQEVIVEVEQRLRRVRTPSPKRRVRKVVYGVRTIYLEDLVAIYRAALETQKPALHDQREIQEVWHQRNELLRSERRHNAKAYVEPPMPDSFASEPLKMRNEEFEFDNIEEVAQLQRRHFQQFDIFGWHGMFRFHIAPEWTYVESSNDDEATTQAIEEIERILRNRQSRPVAFLYKRENLIAWTALLLIGWIAALFTDSTVISLLIGALTWGTFFVTIWFFERWLKRKRVIVPKFEAEAHKTLMEAHGLTIGTIATIVAAILGFLAWWFPRN